MFKAHINEYTPYISLAGGLIAMAISVFKESKSVRLKETGLEADGIILKQASNKGTNEVKDKITIRFVTQKQEWITGLIDQDLAMSYYGQYKDGEHIKVYFEEDNPSNYYVNTKQSESTTRIFFALLGLAMSSVGLYLMFK